MIDPEKLAAERDYLLARAEAANIMRFDDGGRWTGVSSNALVRYAFGGMAPALGEYPADPSDLASCYRAAKRLPEHLRARGESLLPSYRQEVLKRYPLEEHDAVLKAEGVL